MKKILVLGAGKSATTLISYLLEHAQQFDWYVTVGDYSLETATQKVGNHERGKAVFFDVKDAEIRAKYVADCDLVVSVLPANFHILVAKDCLKYKKHIITPSYISPEQKALDADFKAANLLFMGEIGLDPGIDHMSIMKMMKEIRQEGGQVQAVRSFTGALIAPESDTNPWHYKFTWAPMNVVLAGQGTAQYLKNGHPQYVPYNRLFELTETYHVDDCGTFEAYANRDSLHYLDAYQIEDVPTFIRGTLRYKGYCEAWNAFVRLGLTDNNIKILNLEHLTYNDLIDAFLPSTQKNDTRSVKERLAEFLDVGIESDVMDRLSWLGLFELGAKVGKGAATPAKILHDLLAKKWELQPDDKDMIVMLHIIDYLEDGEEKRHTSSLILKGENAEETAISSTVGLPMAIMAKLLLNNEISLTGVHMPIMPEVYEPCLKELEKYGVTFLEKQEVC